MLRDDEISDMIEMLEKHFQSNMSTWECDFLTSIRDQWEVRKSLSPRQREKLDEIAERCARGYGGSSRG